MRILTRGLIILATILFAAGIAVYVKLQQTSVYRTYTSPDKKFKLVLYSYHRIIAMPGSGSDARGLLCLYDEKSGRELNRCKVDIVQDVEQIEWSPTNVYVPLIADWKLPNVKARVFRGR